MLNFFFDFLIESEHPYQTLSQQAINRSKAPFGHGNVSPGSWRSLDRQNLEYSNDGIEQALSQENSYHTLCDNMESVSQVNVPNSSISNSVNDK